VIPDHTCFECHSVVGQLHDEVLQHTCSRVLFAKAKIALANRRWDKHGTIVVGGDNHQTRNQWEFAHDFAKCLQLDHALLDAGKEIQLFANTIAGVNCCRF